MADAPSATFRVLGPLEVWVDERRLTIGSGRQRTLLALLLIREGDAVPVERLIDELWGDEPPRSAGHALEAYVSRLRRALSEIDVTIERRGASYRLDVGRAQVDGAVFEELVTRALEASARGDFSQAGARARAALSLWRGDAYADVAFPGGAPSEAMRLDELRLVAHEHEIDAALAAGEHTHAIGELRALLETTPFREGFVSRLMLALYRAGRQTDALAVYETYRGRLSEDLGLEPSPPLRQLSGQIVRHEEHLAAPSWRERQQPRSVSVRRRLSLMAGIAALVAIAAAAGMAALLHTSAASKGPLRVGLVLPRKPSPGREDAYISPYVNGLWATKQQYHIRAATIVAPEFNATPAQLRRLDRAIRSNRFDLVLVAGSGDSARHLIAQSGRFHHTRIAIIDYGLGAKALQGKKNVTGLTFDDAQAGELAGYLAALVEQATTGAPARISAIGGDQIPQVNALIEGYERGARRAVPGIHIRVDYSGTFVDQATCERIANAQISRRSGVVFAPAGTCGLGALAATGIRGKWGIGADADRSGFSDRVLASTIARFDRGVELAVGLYEQGSLPGGKVLLLGLDDGAVGITGLNAKVPLTIRKKVAGLDSQLRRQPTTHQ